MKIVRQTEDAQDRAQEIEDIRRATSNILKDLEEERTALAIAKAKDEALLASLGDGVIATDNDGKIVLMNPAAEAMLGWKLDEALGKLLAEAVPTEDAEGKRISPKELPISIALASGKTTTTTTTTTTHPSYRYVRKNGTRFPVVITVTPVHLDQKIVGAIEVFRDSTREGEIEKLRMDFISLASHQLRTPLTAIQWVTERILKKEKLSAKGIEYLQDIRVSMKRLSGLVDSLLMVSRLEGGSLEIVPEPLDAALVIRNVLEENHPICDKKKLTIRFISSEKTLSVQTDKRAFRDIVQALFSNAIEYTNPGGAVTVTLKKQDPIFILTVTDTGIGIPQKEQENIFQKFFRAHNAMSVKTDGTGLGLYIAKRAADLLGGTIEFVSDEGKGTTFTVTLPLVSRVVEGVKKFS